jgi:rare lipoprotein A
LRQRIAVLAIIAALAYGCVTAKPQAPIDETLHGVASWYGEEFAGRTTANGEIFDPLLLTAAHRSLPFGTVVDVVNAKTKQSVRVRVNDRGPYIGNRVIDLSYAAAQEIGLVEPGTGEVDIHVVQIGKGDREPPAPYSVTLAEAPKTAPQVSAGDPPKIDFPIPSTSAAPAVRDEPIVIDRVEVAPDGKTLLGGHAATVAPVVARPAAEAAAAPQKRHAGAFVVQVGAFSLEANAKSLQERLARIGQQASIDAGELWRVRIGPFETRELAMKTRATLEANGISAIIVAE